ncbi:MAG: Asp23/Gls24 family envelope stress response protein [Aristaeellaceae bacterium]
MASKKDNLPLTVENDTEQTSTITYANEVVAIIAGVAAGEVEGIAGMCNISGSILTKNRNITKGVKVEIGTEEASVDLYVIIEYGTPIQKAAQDAQENVRKAIESMTGLHVVRVDVHVQGVSFEKENSSGTLTAGEDNAVLEAGSQPEAEAPAQQPVRASEPADDAPAADAEEPEA